LLARGPARFDWGERVPAASDPESIEPDPDRQRLAIFFVGYRMSRLTVGRATTLCMSISARPGTFGSRFHNHLYRTLGLDYVYKAFRCQDLAGALAGVRALGVRGCSVSMPFKESCIPLLDRLGPTARAIGSVNTIVNDAGTLIGHNTDYAAVLALLRDSGLGPEVSFALRGSGGMAKAVAHALREAGFRAGVIVARNRATGRALAEATGYDHAEALPAVERPPLLINATPIGMSGGPEHADLPFTLEQIAACELAFEVVALPAETPFARAAQAAQRRVISGGQVLVLQGRDQFVYYTGVTPSAAQIAAAAEYALS
jgi:shikimate dehydrogenase